MNIFVLDLDPAVAARMQCDKHVVKMVLESAQMLSAAHRVLDGTDTHDSSPFPFLKITHNNHPCTVWVRQSAANYQWLYDHFKALSDEYTYRYYKLHKSWWKLGVALSNLPANIPSGGLTPFAQAMPDEYKHDDPVVAYRQYYVGEKSKFLRYRNRRRPAWLEDMLDEAA